MSDDLVKRLREDQPVTQDMGSTMQCALQDEAADRIEKLEDKLAKAVEALRWQADIINDSLTGNEVGKHRILLDGEYHEGPVVNWVHKILTGFEHINRATIAKLTGGQKDE